VTEVPEHLLRRSKDARSRATGGGGEGSEPPATPSEGDAGAAASAVEPAGAGAVAPAAAAVPAEPAKPVPPYVADALRRPKVPKYAITVLAALPVWALIYAGSMVKTTVADPVFAEGEKIYATQCSGCHGPNGTDGQTGRPLNEVVGTFPDVADHIAWIENGSPAAGTPYGDPAKGRIAGSDGYTTKMPGFKDTLTAEQIAAVAYYERVEFGGQEPAAPGAEGAEGSTSSGGEGH
jgi:mono/diheme cytochrome c family protein